MKTCSKCHAELPLSGFSKQGSGKRSRCRACAAALSRAWYAAHREERMAYNAAHYADNPNSWRISRLMRRYGLTPAEWAEMFEQQGGLCAIRGCGNPATHIDHCHDCEDVDRRGSVRGLLCHVCNRHLDHIARFSSMHAAYLAVHAAVCPAREPGVEAA